MRRGGRRMIAAPFKPLAFAALAALAGCMKSAVEPRNFVVFFPIDDAALTPEAQKSVAGIAAATRDAGPSRFTVEGGADGGTPHDATLADERALAVIHALVEDGVDAGSIEKRPSAPPNGSAGVAAHEVIVRIVP